MSQTFYIESDEEIISVIGRLRKSSAEENIFVFPKRALVLQSIINLRLFQREAEKLGKKITVVSQDEVGRMLAAKAGIETENYSEDFSQKAAHLELTSQKVAAMPQSLPKALVSVEEHMPHSNAIGSVDFYAQEAAPAGAGSVPPLTIAPQAGTSLRVRNASPETLTSLNSKRFEQNAPSQTMSIRPRLADVPPLSGYASPASPQPSVPVSQQMPRQDNGERLKNFYNGTIPAAPAVTTQRVSASAPQATVGKKAHMIFFILGGISLLSLVAVVLFFVLPKAEVHVTPYRIVQTIDTEFNGTADSVLSEEDVFPVRMLEKDIEVAVTVATTGKSGGANQKAHGTVILYNNYNTEPQSLVATTRLETADGKIFRLQGGVTVPAMAGNESGAREATVIADQAGAEYNIEATTFTIPGFKGGAKYDKFSAKSTKAMTGGGSGGVSDVAVVTKVDVDAALREATEKAKGDFLSGIRDALASDEKILDEELDIVPLVAPDLPSIGTVASAFDYRGTFRVRAFAFSEKVVKEKVAGASEKNFQGMRFRPVFSSITYGDSSADFASGTLRVRAHALVTMESDIDKEKLQVMLLGKNEDGIKQVLESFPEVKNIQVIFHPQWFAESIPNSQKRVTLVVEPSEDGP
ncbi:MAG: hypothetical protein WAV46_04405 [Candidatus Moraniibacteriota bacterium]